MIPVRPSSPSCQLTLTELGGNFGMQDEVMGSDAMGEGQRLLNGICEYPPGHVRHIPKPRHV